jgi:predicted porin
MGLAVGYAGFALEAGYSRVNAPGDLFAPITRGLDLGLSYAGETWKTSLMVAGTEADKARALLPSLRADRTYSVELGAAYLITPSLSLTGGLKYSVDERKDAFGVLSRPDKDRGDSTIYVGTAIKF